MNYIDDWLILAQSHQLAVRHRDVILAHMKELGLQLNAKKSVLFPLQKTTFLGMAWDSTSMQARLLPAWIESILSAVKRIKLGQSLTVSFRHCLMAAASNVLLYMRSLQWWLRTKGFSLRGNPFRLIKVTLRCLCALVMWKKPWFLSLGSLVGSFMSLQDANDRCLSHGLGSDFRGMLKSGSVEEPSSLMAHQLSGDDGCISSSKEFPSRSKGPTCAHPLRQHIGGLLHKSPGGLRSHPLCKLACQILLWSQWMLLSLRAACIPAVQNIGADILSRQGLRPGEWRLYPEVVEMIWREFGQAQVDLFASMRDVFVHSGSPSRIQLLPDWTQWCRRGQGFV